MKTAFKIMIIVLILSSYLMAGGGIEQQIESLESQLTNSKSDIPVLLELGKLYHQMAASSKNKKAIKKAESHLKQVLQYDKNNAEALVWLGSLNTLKGRDAWMPWNKLKYVEDGLKLMDRAVSLDRHNIKIRLVRANNNASLPSFFNRADSAIADFQFILKMVEITPEKFAFLPVSEMYLTLGDLYLSLGEDKKAMDAWNAVLEKFPTSKSAKHAIQNLQKVRGL